MITAPLPPTFVDDLNGIEVGALDLALSYTVAFVLLPVFGDELDFFTVGDAFALPPGFVVNINIFLKQEELVLLYLLLSTLILALLLMLHIA